MNAWVTNGLARTIPVLVASCVILSATPGWAGTPLEDHQKRIGKSAPISTGVPERPKGTCVCQQIGNNVFGRAGYLRQLTFSAGTGTVEVDCVVPRFNAAGEDAGLGSCQIFVPLPK